MANASKYPAILIDEEYHSPNGALNQHALTVEEYYDLMHHSHPGLEGGSEGGGASSEEINMLTTRINSMQTVIDEQTSSINRLQSIIEELQSQVSRMSATSEETSSTVSALHSTVSQIQEDNIRRDQNAFDIGDWNATTPEIETTPE